MDKLKELFKALFGDKFTGDVESKIDEGLEAFAEESATGLKSKNEELLGEVKKLKDRLRNASAGKGDDVTRYTDEIETLTAENKKLSEALDKLTADSKRSIDKLTKETKAAYDTEHARADKATNALHKLVKEDGISKALASINVVDPALLEGAKAILLPQVQLVVDGDEFKAQVGDKPLADFVKEWSLGDLGKHYVTAPVSSGGGAGGSGSGGTGKKLTRADFEKLNPAQKADAMRQVNEGKMEFVD